MVGRLPRQGPVAHRAAVQPGHQQDPLAGLLAGQAVGEVVALSHGGHERIRSASDPDRISKFAVMRSP